MEWPKRGKHRDKMGENPALPGAQNLLKGTRGRKVERQRETGTESDAHTGRNKDRRRCPIVDVCDPFDFFTVEFSES